MAEAVLLGIIRRYRDGERPLMLDDERWVWADVFGEEPHEELTDAELAVFAEVSE